jgi:lysophospholipase L1-like esterase
MTTTIGAGKSAHDTLRAGEVLSATGTGTVVLSFGGKQSSIRVSTTETLGPFSKDAGVTVLGASTGPLTYSISDPDEVVTDSTVTAPNGTAAVRSGPAVLRIFRKYNRIAFLGDSLTESLGDGVPPFAEGTQAYSDTFGITYGAQMGGTWTGAGQLNELGAFLVWAQPLAGFTHPNTYNIRFDGANGLACKLSGDADYGTYVNVTGGGFFVLTAPGGTKLRVVIRWRFKPAAAAVSNPTTANALALFSSNGLHCYASRLTLQTGMGNARWANFGIQSDRSDDVLARIGQVAVFNPDLTCILIGANDPGRTYASIVADQQAIWDVLQHAGSDLFVMTTYPLGDPTAAAVATRQLLAALRRWQINTGNARTNVYVADATPFLSANGTNGGVNAALFKPDFIHLLEAGASAAAVPALQIVAGLPLTGKSAGNGGVLDAYDATNNPQGNIFGSIGKFIGTGGGAGGFATGSIPAGCTMSRTGADIACACTAPDDGSPVARTDGRPGNWFRLSVSVGNTTDGQYVEVNTGVLGVGGGNALQVGDFVRFRGIVKASSIAALRELRIRVGATDNSNYNVAFSLSSVSTTWTQTAAETFEIVGPVFKVQNTANFRCELRIGPNKNGTCIVDTQDWCLEKVTP